MDLIRTEGVELKENAGPLKRKIWLSYLGNTIIMESCLSSSIESETCTTGILIFFHSGWVFFIRYTFRMIFSLDKFISSNIIFMK